MKTLLFVCALLAPQALALRLSVFGSSVAGGIFADIGCPVADGIINACSYQEHMRQYQLGLGSIVTNISIGGDTTLKLLNRFDTDLLPTEPDIVLIGISLANEGLIANVTASFSSFVPGMETLINKMHDLGYKVIIGGCYANTNMYPEAYEATKVTNAIINTWDVPSINFLGSVDDGEGKWIDSLRANDKHPNGYGHLEMYRTIVPSVFEALLAGKPTPVRAPESVFSTLDGEQITYVTEDVVMHAFTTSVRVRVPVQSAEPTTLLSIELPSPAMFDNQLRILDGAVYYRAQNGGISTGVVLEEDTWYTVTFTHYWGLERSKICVSADAEDAVPTCVDYVGVDWQGEQLAPVSFTLGDSNPPLPVDVKDFLIYRSSWNIDEITDLAQGKLLQSSLEVYAPLSRRYPTENAAQSLATLTVSGADDDEPATGGGRGGNRKSGKSGKSGKSNDKSRFGSNRSRIGNGFH